MNVDEILYLKADNNTTDFYMSDGTKISAYKTLKVFEDLLPKTFLRIHKSYIINRNCISRIHYGKSMCILNNEHKIPFTKTFIENIDLINSALSHNTLITLN
nr:LytTR family DNA-binding domain-containing protein [Mariniflexile gromovii]